jgi:hypothetical protein
MRKSLLAGLAGKLVMVAAVVAMLVPGLASANTAGVIHRLSGRLYVVTGTGTPTELRQQAHTACLAAETSDPKSAQDCAYMLNEPYGACDDVYGKGFQVVTVGGIKWHGKQAAYSGFLSCGKTQADADANFNQHCANSCTIWQHYTDADNK